MKNDRKKLDLWQKRLADKEAAYAGELAKMGEREALYLGSTKIKPIAREDVPDEAPHLRNVVAELVEAQVSSSIPQPKVSARRKRDEAKAKLIEDMLRDELDRMNFEELNDQQERTVPIQGGGAYLVEWDSTRRTHTTSGEVAVSLLHPKKIIPQDGVYTGIEDMDYIIVKVPQTKEYIKRRYGVDVGGETEEEPDVRGQGESMASDLVTQYMAYYRNGKGGIGLYSWVNDTGLEDLEDYQARRLRRCAKCGALEPAPGTMVMAEATLDGTPAGGGEWRNDGTRPPDNRETGRPNGREVCPYCGASKWEESEEEFEEVLAPIARSDGSVIEPLEPVLGPDGMPLTQPVTGPDGTPVMGLDGLPVTAPVVRQTKIPYYKPDVYPIVLQKNISVFGRFLGGSDVDTIASQQNTVNRLETKMLDKLLTAGSYMTLPVDATVERNAGEMKLIRLTNPSDKSLIDVYDLEGDVTQDITMLQQTYEEMRQVIGITDSFQGRRDTTATSGTAKQFAAAQTAGRLESKRIMKNAAFQRLFEVMFKFRLAYADEPRPVTSYNAHGEREYSEFNRYDFLEKDEAGEWYWNDQFIFAVDDTSATLASNREAMWEETRMNFQSGAFGDPAQIDTLLLFWTKMEMLHYPGAGETKTYLEEMAARQAAAAQAQQEQQAQVVAMQAQMAGQAAQSEAEAEGTGGRAASGTGGNAGVMV